MNHIHQTNIIERTRHLQRVSVAVDVALWLLLLAGFVMLAVVW